MINLLPLIKNTGAYRTIKGDKENGRLSHAYLILCADEYYLEEYLKIFASVIACDKKEPCGECRACKLIAQKNHPDVTFYPKNTNNIVTEDINDLIELSYLKPVESDKKIFVLCGGENMTPQAQNKLLKTLEEPPKDVHILIGSLSEYPLLTTVRSRTKKLEIPSFSADKLFNALIDDCPNDERLLEAIACGDGTVGKAKAFYGDDTLATVIDLAIETLIGMQSSKDVLKYSVMITNSKVELDDFFSVTELLLRDMLVEINGGERFCSNKRAMRKLKNTKGFTSGAIVYALDKITQAKTRKKFNGGGAMLLEWLLFSILEGKHKWQKL